MTDHALVVGDHPVAAAKNRALSIRADLDLAARSIDTAIALVKEAATAGDDVALGYPSWTAYVAEEFGEALAELGRGERRDVVGILSEIGMSTRAIASVVDVDHSTVVRDLQVVQCAPRGQDDDRRVVGLDNKAYPGRRAEPPPRRRRPLNASLKDAVWNLEKVAQSLDRWTKDDRFSHLSDSDRAWLKNHLARSQKTLFEARQRFGA